MATKCRPLWPLPGVLIVNGRKNSMGRRREVGFYWVAEGMLLCRGVCRFVSRGDQQSRWWEHLFAWYYLETLSLFSEYDFSFSFCSLLNLFAVILI